MMEQILQEGKADVIYMARELLADPFLPQKVMGGHEDRIVKCLRCFTCMAERPVTFTRRCAVNPLIGREIEGMEVLPAAHKKKVMVVGAGVAGLKAAITAAQRGHQVILCEKSSQVGGILKSEQAIPFKHEMYELGLTLEKQALDEGVEIRLNTPVTPEYVEQEKPQALILAVGSTPIVPPLPGIDSDNVVIVNNYYLEKDKVADTVVVLGGGLAGCECAVHLGQEGKQVHLVEMRDTLAPDCNIRHRPILMKQIAQYVTAHTGYAGLKITPEGLLCRTADGSEVLVPGKTIVCAVGQRANRPEVEKLRLCAPFVREVGDCIRPANITKAVYEGYHAALAI
jgi:pyruvate/2-oxoglutarate dehydrogenase complex dihydrolipoamide dehydrogenase (E3) component